MAIVDYDAKYNALTGWVAVRNKQAKRGVLIEYPSGQIIFKSNKDFPHIQPLEPGPKDIFL